MDAKVKALLGENHKLKSVFAAAVSNMMVAIAEVSGDPDTVNSPDLRENVIGVMSSLLSSDGIDKTCWPVVKDGLFYDTYLVNREAASTLTPFDLLRPGLIEANFSTLSSYFDHYQRVLEERKRLEGAGATTTKVCTKCNESKPASAFKRGCVCNTCRSRSYRERTAARDKAELELNRISTNQGE